MTHLYNCSSLYRANVSNQEALFILESCQQTRLFDCQLARKGYLQINAFVASGGRVEKNLEALLMKATESVSGEVREIILNSINESFSGSHNVVIRDQIAWT